MSKQSLPDIEDDEKNICVLLLSTHLEDYQLAYTLNKFCSTSFVSVFELTQFSKIKSDTFVSLYYNAAKAKLSASYLVNNQLLSKISQPTVEDLFTKPQLKTSPLLKEHPKWPYFLLFSNDLLAEWTTRIKIVRAITASQTIHFQSLSKSDKNIINTFYYEE